jgi:hypothetical protein
MRVQITCASCKSIYNLTTEQVEGLSHSILPCAKCNKFIKISICPYCYSYYSITFTSTNQEKYKLTCEQCAKPFVVDFPLIKDANNTGSRFDLLQNRDAAPSAQSVSFTLGNLFSICGSAFTLPKLAVAAIAIIISLILLMGYNLAINLAFTSGEFVSNDYIKSFLTIIPFAIIFFAYMMASAIIARITIDAINASYVFTARRALEFLIRAFPPVFLTNIFLFISVELVFILFGKIPIVGPVLFAVLFLPIYITSLCIVILLAIGIWFYPPLIAGSDGGTISSIRSFLRFVRKQNFNLAYTIPLMTILTGLTFTCIYLLHYSSFKLSIHLAKSVLTDDGEKIFSSIPSALLQLSDLATIGSETGLYKSLLNNLLLAHTIGGSIIGIVFSLISIVLFASFISISSTLSTHLYIMMEKGTDMDDASKLRILMLLVLILFGIFLVKKILF